MNEEWKDVRDYEGLYQVSNLGRVRRFYKNGKIRIRKNVKVKNYLQISLTKKGCKTSHPLVHVLVFETFCRRLLPNEDVHHVDGCTTNNVLSNLVAKDSIIHRRAHKMGNKWNVGKKHSQQTRKKISEANNGHLVSLQSRLKMSNSAKNRIDRIKDPKTGQFIKKEKKDATT